MSQIDRRSGIPLYLQIKHILADEIAENPAQARGMTEQQLTQRFRVSRATVRQALQEMVTAGLIYRERSKGTFPVERVNIDRPATLQVGGLVGYLQDQGLHPTSEVSDVHRDVPSEEVGAALALEPGERVLSFRRRIMAKGGPLSLARVYLRSPDDFAPTVEELEAAGSAIALLEERHGIVVTRSEHHVWATGASPEESAALDIEPGSPILALETRLMTREGHPVVWRRISDRSDLIKHTFVSNVV
ncbi:GntR family transcriptional regulator [Microbacterium sp. A204]|uniref:GntR family transcriptional regulator n=1 Tax=Microbacterium sp. A204 TaxID=3457321 RepID=UPI003FD5D475